MTPKIGDARRFLWANGLSSFPDWLFILALGWTIEWVDERYGSALMSRKGGL